MLDNLARVVETPADEAVPYVARGPVPARPPVADNDARPVLPSHDKAAFEAKALIGWCDDQMYLRPTKVLEVQGDPLSVLARVAQKLPEMTDMGADSYDALLARLTEQVNDFSAAMTSGFIACKIMYQDNADDLAQTLKDGETRQFIAFTADGQMIDSHIQGRERHLTLGGGGYQVDDMAQFQNALTDRRHIMVELYAKGSRDDVSAEQGGLSHGMIAPLMQQLMAEPETLRAMATEIATQERFAASNDKTPVHSAYLPEPVNMALATMAHDGVIAPAMVDSLIAPVVATQSQTQVTMQQAQPVQQTQTITQPETRRVDTVVTQAPPTVVATTAPEAPAQKQPAADKPVSITQAFAEPVQPKETVSKPNAAEIEKPAVTIVTPVAPVAAAPAVAAPVMGMGGGGSSSASSAAPASYQAARVEAAPSAPAVAETPKDNSPKVDDKKPEAAKIETAPVAETPKAADPVKAPEKIEPVQPQPMTQNAAPVVATPSAPQQIASVVEAPKAPEAVRPAEVKAEQPRAETPKAVDVPSEIHIVSPQAAVSQPQTPAQPQTTVAQAAPMKTEFAGTPTQRETQGAGHYQAPPRHTEKIVPFPQREDTGHRSPQQQPDQMQFKWRDQGPVNTYDQRPETYRFTTVNTGTGLGGGSQQPHTHHQPPKQTPTQAFGGCAGCATKNCSACPALNMARNINNSYKMS